MNPCEWDPRIQKVGDVVEMPEQECPNEATISVGGFHVCESCAALPVFKRFRKRVPLHKTVDTACPEPIA